MIIRGTTPTIKIRLPDGINCSEISELWLTISQGCRLNIDKNMSDADKLDDGFEIKLSQTDTLKLYSTNGNVEIQARIRTIHNDAIASEIIIIPVGRILKDGEI